jgi:hypothetical protein
MIPQNKKGLVRLKLSGRAERHRETTGFCDLCGRYQTPRGLTLYKNKFVCERCLISNDNDLYANPYGPVSMLAYA